MPWKICLFVLLKYQAKSLFILFIDIRHRHAIIMQIDKGWKKSLTELGSSLEIWLWYHKQDSLIQWSHVILSSSLYLSLYCSIFLSLNLSVSLRDRDWADTIITFHYHPHHSKLFKNLRVDLYSSVKHYWNCLLKPILFLHWKHSVNWGHYLHPLSAIGVRDVWI